MTKTPNQLKIAAWLVLILLTTLIACQNKTNPSQSVDSSDNGTITLGALLPLSGKNALYGNEIKNAIELAREEINRQGGINGKNLEIIYEDDQADPKTGTAGMQKLVHLHKVSVVLGSWVSGVVVASAPIAEEAEVIVMAEAISPTITNLGDYIFRIQPSATYYSAELIKTVNQASGINQIAILYINNEFGKALRDSVKQEVEETGGQIVVEKLYSSDDQDFRSQLSKIKRADPQAIFIGGYQEQFDIIRQARELGLTQTILAGPPFENPQAVKDLGELAQGVIYPYHFVADLANQQKVNYLQAYKNKYGTESGGFAPLMYDAVYIIKQAMEKCDQNTECIKDELYQTQYDGVSGEISFDQNGDPLIPIVVKTVERDNRFVKFEK